jgi:putative toxin-antitoxin system antitoxin component (TIGR02293 family)
VNKSPVAATRASVEAQAFEVLEGREKALRWLGMPNTALGGKKPLDLLDTELGAKQVEAILGRIESGVYS